MSETNSPSRNITMEGMEEEPKKAPTQASIFNAKNYLNDRLEDGKISKELKIRLLPVDKDSNTAFTHIHMHTIRVPKEVSSNGWKSYVCLAKNDGPFTEKLGKKCPFCELNSEYYKKSVEAENEVDKKRFQELSLSYKAKEVSIIRCIERGAEEDGPKFWKFNLRKDKKDPEGIIRNLYKTRKQESIDQETEDNDGVLPEDFIPLNILDVENGKDLKVTISAVLDEQGKPTDKKGIEIVDYGKVKPLSMDGEKMNAWLEDEKVWSDVFVAKPYEYLKIVSEGEVPWFDKQNGKWVKRDDFNNNQHTQTREEGEKITQEINNAVSQASKVNDDDNDEELPY